VLEGRVAVVTGGGRGLGRAYALDLARHGATVVVNDPGVALDGSASSDRPADRVVAEIVNAGGSALASYDDIAIPEGAATMIASAAELGRVDAVVNNAGIMRDRSFAKLPIEDFEAVVRVHLLGSGYVTKAAWPHLIASGAGRVVFISSSVGLYGGFGQANYAAAKMGVVGLLKALVQEGARHGVCLNAVAPVGRSRMSEPLLDPEIAAGLSPELVAPVVTYLCSPVCTQSGAILEVGAGLIAPVRVVEGDGIWIDGTFDAATVARRIGELSESGQWHAFESSDRALERVFDRARSRSASTPRPLDPDARSGH
jgi:NAD(P)-dependent dehydrogenase (short-subunit alcohol dehydrogenase family)